LSGFAQQQQLWEHQLTGVLDPTLAQDAATKKLCRYRIKLK
jgi:hypothetical protein